MKTKQRLFYFGMVNTQPYANWLNLPLHIGAAANKMTGVVRALRCVGTHAYLVSMPVLGHFAQKRHAKGIVFKDSSCPQIFLPVAANRYIRKIISLFFFAWFCILKIRPIDRVIFYNHSIEYILALLILNFKGNKPFLDIEDSPRSDEGVGHFRSLLFDLYRYLTRDKKLIVSNELAQKLALSNYCVVHGVSSARSIIPNFQKWTTAPISLDNDLLRVHYGGTLTVDTGVDLFCDAVIKLKNKHNNIAKLTFIITGFGSIDKIEALIAQCWNSNIKILYYPDISQGEYFSLLLSCHASLCLKLPESEMAMTTFPSKVVEITSSGLLLISTKASDVPTIFDQDSAVLLQDTTPDALVTAILIIMSNMPAMHQVAIRGHDIAMKLFDPKTVGSRVDDFLMINYE